MNSLRRFRLVPFVLLSMAAACSAAPPSGSGADDSVDPAASPSSPMSMSGLNMRDWRRAMAKTPVPKEGCFKAAPGASAWEEVACGKAAPPMPYAPAMLSGPRAASAETVGNGTDYAAQTSGTISWSEGSFPYVSGLTSAVDGSTDNFSLQLNTNTFTSPACGGAKNPASCVGWQQFIYAPGAVFQQYWLIGYNATCPSGWFTFNDSCYKNSSHTASVGTQPISALGNLVLTASAGTTDTVAFFTADGTLYAASEPSVLDLKDGWNASEYNIVGNANGSEITFNSGSTIVVQTLINSTTGTAPATCLAQGFTGETNNLTIVPGSCCPMGGAEPGIRFTQSNAASAAALACPTITQKPSGSPIAASRQFGMNQTDVASIDNNGQLNLTWALQSEPWNEAVQLSPAIFPAGAPVAMSQQFGLNQTDVFAVNKLGAVDVTFALNGGTWANAEISGRGLFPSGAPIAASQQFGLTQTDAFVIDNGGRLNVLWAAGGGRWAGPAAISGASFPARGHLAVSQQFGVTQTDVFAVDNAGALTVTFAAGGGNWAGPVEISPRGRYAPGAPIAVSQQAGVTQTDVFIVNTAGDLDVLWASGGGACAGPVNITSGSQYKSGAEIAASRQFDINQTDVFVTNKSGFRTVMWALGGGSWTGPVQIP